MTPTRGLHETRGLFAYGLITFVMLVFANALGLPGGASVGQMMLLAGFLFWGQSCLARKETVFGRTVGEIAGFVLFSATFLALMAFASMLYAADPFRVGRVVLSMLAGLAVFAFVRGTLDLNRSIQLVFVVVCTLGLVSLISIAALVVPPLEDFIFKGTDRAHGTFKNANQYGIVLSTITPVTAALIAILDGKKRWIAGICLGLMIIALLLSGSKTNLILTSAGLSAFAVLFVLATRDGADKLLYLGLALISIVLLLVIGYLLLAQLNPRAILLFETFLDPNQTVPSLNSRRFLWGESMATFAANPWFGEGAGQRLVESPSGDTISHSHNLFIEYARTLGAPGLVAISIIVLASIALSLISLVRGVFEQHSDITRRAMLIGLSLGCLAHLAANMTSESFGPSTTPFFWFTLSLLCLVNGPLWSPTTVTGRNATRTKFGLQSYGRTSLG
ncbi:MAG: O-antigen ligase family protein [Pseudomonadota bacterium]